MLHRDLRPANVLVADSGMLKVADFGTSRFLEIAAHGTTVIGSPPYMAPEQFHGKAVFASDLYSVGVTMYQMLTGVLPYDTPSPADLDRLMRGELVTAPRLKNPKIPKAISDIVVKALAPEIHARYQRACELLDDVLARQGRELAADTAVNADRRARRAGSRQSAGNPQPAESAGVARSRASAGNAASRSTHGRIDVRSAARRSSAYFPGVLGDSIARKPRRHEDHEAHEELNQEFGGASRSDASRPAQQAVPPNARRSSAVLRVLRGEMVFVPSRPSWLRDEPSLEMSRRWNAQPVQSETGPAGGSGKCARILERSA